MFPLQDDRAANLLFLLSLGSLATGCPGDDSSGTSAASTGGDSTTGGAPATTSGPDATTSGGPGGTTTAGPGDSSTGSPPATSGTTDGGGTATDTGLGLMCDGRVPMVGPIDPNCTAYVTLISDCYYGGDLPPECVTLYEAYCQQNIEFLDMTYGGDCSMAFSELFACMSMLSCREFMDDVDDCVPETMAVDAACM